MKSRTIGPGDLRSEMLTFVSNFSTPRTVCIRNVKLGILLRLLQLVVVCYFIYSICILQNYMKVELPRGTVNPWAEEVGYEEAYRFNSRPFYCNNPEYDFVFSSQWTYESIGCRHLPANQVWSKGTQELFISTYVTEKHSFSACGGDTHGDSELCPSNQTVHQYFVIHPEYLRIKFDHTVTTSWGMVVKNPPLSVVMMGDSRVLAQFPQGSTVAFQLNDLLQHAGVESLNALNPDGTESANIAAERDDHELDNSTYPHYRLSGVPLFARLQYTNQAGWFDETLSCQMQISLGRGWGTRTSSVVFTKYPTDTMHRYESGVKIVWEFSGGIGQAAVIETTFVLFSVIVALQVVQWLVDFLAMYCLGLYSTVYRESIRTTMSKKGDLVDTEAEVERARAKLLEEEAAVKSSLFTWVQKTRKQNERPSNPFIAAYVTRLRTRLKNRAALHARALREAKLVNQTRTRNGLPPVRPEVFALVCVTFWENAYFRRPNRIAHAFVVRLRARLEERATQLALSEVNARRSMIEAVSGSTDVALDITHDGDTHGDRLASASAVGVGRHSGGGVGDSLRGKVGSGLAQVVEEDADSYCSRESRNTHGSGRQNHSNTNTKHTNHTNNHSSNHSNHSNTNTGSSNYDDEEESVAPSLANSDEWHVKKMIRRHGPKDSTANSTPRYSSSSSAFVCM